MATNLRSRITRLEQRIDLRPLCSTCGGGNPIKFTLRVIRGDTIPHFCPDCGCPPPRPSIYVIQQLCEDADMADAAGMPPEPLPPGVPGD